MAKFKKAKDIKVGVIGYGGAFNMGKIHLNEMNKAGMTPIAVMDLDADRLKEAEKDFPGIATYTSLPKMLKSDVNLIVIITPHNTHAKLALQCLRAGKHVVCEKPLAITTAECDAMIAAAKKSKVVLSTYHNRHWDGCILEAMDRIKKQKVIGDVVRVEAHMGGFGQPGNWWRSSKSISGGILYDWGVHLLEYTLQLMDSDIVEVSGFAKTGVWASKTAWKNDTNEDEGFLTVRYSSGAWSSLCVSQLDANPKRGMLEITGTKGTYIMEGGTYEIICPETNGSVTITKGINRPNQGADFYQNIADHMVKGTTLVISPEWSRRPIHILDLAHQSMKKSKAMTAKYK
ncbi:MAG: Gfo/Idh/MocA family oxidoreductase [Sedimentisphaerales bacterium]|nr:Gfo/Idh/MocA family oxidoreductase [Sedimentisphaerales bacterium]